MRFRKRSERMIVVKKRLILLAASLAMLQVATAALAQESGDEVRWSVARGVWTGAHRGRASLLSPRGM